MIVQDENMLACFVNSEQPPVRVKHICYFTESRGDEINLCEVYDAFYPHPEAPEDAIIPVTRMRTVRTVRRTSIDAGHLILMEANQKSCRYIEVRG